MGIRLLLAAALASCFLFCPTNAKARFSPDGLEFWLDPEPTINPYGYPYATVCGYSGTIGYIDSTFFWDIGWPATSICDRAFQENFRVTRIDIANGIGSVGEYAFFNCYYLESVWIAPSVASIGRYAFAYHTDYWDTSTSRLREVEFAFDSWVPANLTRIEEGLFYGCTSLTTITLPPTLTSIGDVAFYGCSSLPSITISSSVTSIGNSAFYGCSSLPSITIPSSVTSNGNSAFTGCTALNRAIFTGSAPAMGSGVFDSTAAGFGVYYPAGAAGFSAPSWNGHPSFPVTSDGLVCSVTNGQITVIGYWGSSGALTIPSSIPGVPGTVTAIADSAFAGCTSLQSLTIASSVTSIGDSAFRGCTGLNWAYFIGNAPAMGSSVFDSTAAGFQVRYRDGAAGFSAPVWNGYSYLIGGNPLYSFSNFVGLPGVSGTTQGTGTAARFNGPTAAVRDAGGNLFVSDRNNHAIFKVTPGGVSTLFVGSPGVSGSANGVGTAARFNFPEGIVMDTAGNLYVAEYGNGTIRKVTPGGAVSTLAGSPALIGTADGTGSAARFFAPKGLAIDALGNLYVADTSNHSIRQVTPAGAVTTVAGKAGTSGNANGTGTSALFNSPTGIECDGAGNFYITEYQGNTIRKMTSSWVVTTLAGCANVSGTNDGMGSAARFRHPMRTALDSNGNLYVADQGNNSIRKVTVATGAVTTVGGMAGTSGTGAQALRTGTSFVPLTGSLPVLPPQAIYHYVLVYATSDGSIFFGSDQTFAPPSHDAQYAFANLAGLPGISGSANGTGAAARFYSPMGVALDIAGNLYVADSNNQTVRKITPSGAVTILAGAAGYIGSVNGTGTAARFNLPDGLAVDASGTVYVADAYNHTIRKITAAGAVTTLAGAPGLSGSANGIGAAARFNNPVALVVGTGGALYVADSSNHAIRKVSSVGAVTTVAGLPGVFGSVDATGSAARFNSPSGIAIDSVGSLYVADSGNSTIRKLTLTGSLWSVSTLAGTPGFAGAADGLAGAARFACPVGIAVDAAENVFVANYFSHNIRKVTPAGLVSTIGGSAGFAGSADGIGSAAGFANPCGLAVDGFGNLYVGDNANNRITKGTPLQASGYGGGFGNGIAVSGSANPHGLDSAAWFEYGPTSDYGSQTAPQAIGDGAQPVPVNDTLPVASASNSIVHFRLVVYNRGGNFYGADSTTGPGYVVNPAAATGTSVTLSASVNPSGFAGPASNPANVLVFWQYGLVSGSYGLTSGTQSIGTGTATVPVTFTRARAGLSTAIYHYRVAISSTLGTIYGPDQVFSFVAPSVVVKTPSVTLAGATAQATVNPNGVDTTVYIQYGLTTAYTNGTIAQALGSGLAPVTVTGSFTGLTPNTLYHYRVVTLNSLGTVNGPDQTLAPQALYGTAAVAWSKGAVPGIAGATFSAFGNPAVNDADHVAFQATVTGAAGSGIATSNNSGIWADSGTSGRTLIVRTGQRAPSYAGSGLITGTFATLGDPVYANDDAIAFIGTLVKTGTTLSDIRAVNNTGVWTTLSGSLTLVARTGDPAPDANGNISASGPLFASFAQIVLPNQGGVVILGNLVTGTNGVVATNNQGIWVQDAAGVLKQAIRKGDNLTVSGSAKAVSGLSIFNGPANGVGQSRHFNSTGDLLLKVSFSDASSAFAKVFSAPGSPTTVVARIKTPAAAVTGGTFSALGNPIMNNSGDFAFQATLSANTSAGIGTANNSGIWVDSGTTGRALVARTGSQAPGYAGAASVTGTFATVTDPVFANDDAVAFLGTLVKTGTTVLDISSTNNTGIWTTISGSLTLVARTGDRAPAADGNVTASSPVFASFAQYVLPNQGGVIILANLVAGTAAVPGPGGVVAVNSQGIWAQDTNGVLKQIIRKGDGLTVNGKAVAVSALTIFSAPATATGQTRHFNSAGDILYKASFSDGSTAIIQSVFP